MRANFALTIAVSKAMDLLMVVGLSNYGVNSLMMTLPSR